MRTINVELGDRSYPIFIGNQLQPAALLAPYISGQAVIVSNETIAPLYLTELQHQLQQADIDYHSIILPDGEQYKNWDSLNHVFTELLSHQQDRKTTLIALGGGVVGDTTGFAAACYQRGVAFIQIPTTLLAQVDSSVGGKTAINHAMGKNMIGAFHQPQCVIADSQMLTTLPEREYLAGIAEVIKYGLIRDLKFLRWMEANRDEVLARKPAAIEHMVAQSCLNKADVVAQDETEQGVRAWLNLGHTFGHAIEAHQAYQGWLHGEAVACGMSMAITFSERLNWLAAEEAQYARQLIADYGLPVNPPEDMQTAHFMQYMLRDKKVVDRQIRLVLLQGLGQTVVTSDYPAQALTDYLNSLAEQ